VQDKLLLTACKQYCLAAGATQGNIAYTQTVSNHYHSQNTPKIKFAFGALLVYIYTTTQSL
jgi:hypothetical protein